MCKVQNGFHGFVQKHQCDQLCTAIICIVFTSKKRIRPTCVCMGQTNLLTQPDGCLLKSHTNVNQTNAFIHTAQPSQRNGEARWTFWLMLWVAELVLCISTSQIRKTSLCKQLTFLLAVRWHCMTDLHAMSFVARYNYPWTLFNNSFIFERKHLPKFHLIPVNWKTACQVFSLVCMRIDWLV